MPSMAKAHLIIFEGLTEQDFNQKTYEYVVQKFDEYINSITKQSNEEVSTKKSAEDLAKAEGDKLLKASNDESSTKPEGIIKVDFPLEETVNAWQHSIRNPSGVADYFNVFTYTKNKEATIQSLYSSYSEFEKSKPSDYVATEYFSEFKQGDPKVIGKVIAYSGDYQGILDILASGLKSSHWISPKNRILIANRLKEEIEKDFAEKQLQGSQPQVEANKLIDEDRLKSGEISVNEFISANGLNPDDYDGVGFDEPTQKTQYQTLISEMLGVADKHIALAEKKFASTPQERKAKANTLSLWRNAIYAIGVIQRNFENPFSTRLAIRTDIPNLLKQRFEEKFENLSDAEKYYQAELQSDLISAHRANKAIEWVLKEKSKEADNTIADKAQPQQSTSEPVAAMVLSASLLFSFNTHSIAKNADIFLGEFMPYFGI